MKAIVKLFASYRDMMGQNRIEVIVADGATVGDLLTRVKQRFPQLSEVMPLVAVNAEYVDPDRVLHQGDEIAFLPPVSGGAFSQITDQPVLPEDVIARVRRDECGAVVTFLGTVRSPSQGKEVLYLEYDAYREMAEKGMRGIAAEIKTKWKIEEVAFCHRVGRVGVGEISLVIAVAAPHRREAFEACQYAVDRLKEVVPIWKKEVTADGEAWVGDHGADARNAPDKKGKSDR